MSTDLKIGDCLVAPGERITIELPLPALYTHAPICMPVHVIRGKKPGPTLFLSGAIHGDELNGVEIISRLMRHSSIKRLKGTIIAVPIVNVYGVINHSRYLPDRRDLNRSFPGSDNGSMASRLAALFMKEIISNSTHGIDFHTGAIHRANLPQIRANLGDDQTRELALAFGVPVVMNANLRDGSLREAAASQGIPMLLYEAGEALRFDEISIRAGVRGSLKVMRSLEMLPSLKPQARAKTKEVFTSHSSVWVRAPESGVLRTKTLLGKKVKRGDVMGHIGDPFGDTETQVIAQHNGIVIGQSRLPLVHGGEALFHIARFEKDISDVAEGVQLFQDEALEQGPI